MSHRFAMLRRFMRSIHTHKLVVNRSYIPIFKSQNPVLLQQRRTKSNIWPISDFLETPSMFSIETIKKKYETIPLIIICGVGMLCEFLWMVRQLFTRDDVRFCPKSGQMAFEKGIDKIEKGDKPPIKKFRVYNQKYEYADSLVEALAALREPTEEEKAEMEKQAKKKKK